MDETDIARSGQPYGGYAKITGFVRACVDKGNMLPFYQSAPWKRLRREVLDADHWECQFCKARGRHTRAARVHHERHVREWPELAMSVWYMGGDGVRRRNLISTCTACHETVAHAERRRKTTKLPPVTRERWE